MAYIGRDRRSANAHLLTRECQELQDFLTRVLRYLENQAAFIAIVAIAPSGECPPIHGSLELNFVQGHRLGSLSIYIFGLKDAQYMFNLLIQRLDAIHRAPNCQPVDGLMMTGCRDANA